MTTKNKLINSSIKNFLAFGYRNASLSKIAADVGIKKPSIYYYFKNKEELFITSIEYLIESMENKISYSIKDLSTARNMLNAIFNSLMEFNNDLFVILGDDQHYNKNIFNFFHISVNEFPSLNKNIESYYTFLKKIIIDIIKLGQKNKEIRQDLNEELISLEIIAWIEGLFMLSSLYPIFSIGALRQDFFLNLWRVISVDYVSQKSSLTKKSSPKTISLGTKW